MTKPDDPQVALRRSVYVLLIVISTGVMLGRILAVDTTDRIGAETNRLTEIPGRLEEKRKAFQDAGLAPDQVDQALQQEKRRLTAWALVRRPFLSANDRSRWCTLRALVEPDMRVPGAPYAIDRVIRDRQWNTIDKVMHDGHYYSSKPTLLPTLMAGVYWLVYHGLGLSLGVQTYATVRLLLVLFNVVPLVIYFILLARLAERFGTTDWGRIFVIGAACFGTFLTTFAVTNNNHVPAAAGVMGALYAALRIWFDGQRRLRYFALAGLLAAFTVADELPALSLLAAMFVGLLWKSPKGTLVAFTPAVLVVAAGFFGSNWIAHHSLKPAYAHRNTADPKDDWYAFTENGRPSYWQNPVGIDRGEPSKAVYALHALVGHHGIFSLTPIWAFTVAGLGIWLVKPADGRFRELALLITAVSLVCLLFYLFRPLHDRNYGGMTSGLRWMFWFTPMWLLAMLPALDAAAGRRWLRGVAWVCLTVSVLSASYPTWNPWTHPWLLNYLQYLGWIRL